MDGYQASRLIRNPATPVRNHNIPIVAMTAHAMAGDREKCLAAGMNDYLTKPIQPALLDQTIESWIVSNGGCTVAAIPADDAPARVVEREPFDQDGLVDRVMGDDELARQVVSGFLDFLPHQLAALAQALEAADSDAVRQAAHSIKGAAANAGGPQLSQTARKLEQLGAQGDLAQAAGLHDGA